MDIHNPHDSYFKLLFGELEQVSSYIKNYLPKEVSNKVDTTSLELINKSFVDDKLKQYHSDIIYKCKLSGKDAYLYFLFEHKSSPDKYISLQLLKYILHLWVQEQCETTLDKLPIIVPLVFYHGTKPWNVGLKLSDLIDSEDNELLKYVPDFEYILTDLHNYEPEEIPHDLKLFYGFIFMKYIHDKWSNFELAFSNAGKFLKDLIASPGGLEFLKMCLIYLSTRECNFKEVNKILVENLSYKGDEIAMTLAETLKKEGREEGREQGRVEGREVGREEGEAKAKKRVAKQMLQEGLDITLIAKVCDLSIEEVKTLCIQPDN